MRLHVINLARQNGLVSMKGKPIRDPIAGGRVFMYDDRTPAFKCTVVQRHIRGS
jgi:hypothetical protein